MLLWFLCFVISSLSSYVYVSYRHLIVDDNRPHDRSAVSFSLFKEGAFSTAPINISLHESGIFAWRTLVSSLKGTSFNNRLSKLLDFGSVLQVIYFQGLCCLIQRLSLNYCLL
jgi:hypothetical protein